MPAKTTDRSELTAAERARVAILPTALTDDIAAALTGSAAPAAGNVFATMADVGGGGGGGLTATPYDGTTEEASGGGLEVALTIAVGAPMGLIIKADWEPVSNASVAAVTVAYYADAARTQLLGYLIGTNASGVASGTSAPIFSAMGAQIRYPAVHDSEDSNLYLNVWNKTGGQDGTIKVTVHVAGVTE